MKIHLLTPLIHHHWPKRYFPVTCIDIYDDTLDEIRKRALGKMNGEDAPQVLKWLPF